MKYRHALQFWHAFQLLNFLMFKLIKQPYVERISLKQNTVWETTFYLQWTLPMFVLFSFPSKQLGTFHNTGNNMGQMSVSGAPDNEISSCLLWSHASRGWLQLLWFSSRNAAEALHLYALLKNIFNIDFLLALIYHLTPSIMRFAGWFLRLSGIFFSPFIAGRRDTGSEAGIKVYNLNLGICNQHVDSSK